MLLEDFKRSAPNRLRKINEYLSEQHGFRLSSKASNTEIVSLKENTVSEMDSLKMNGHSPKDCPDLSKCMLVLEGIEIITESQLQTDFVKNERYLKIVDGLAEFVSKNVGLGDGFNDALTQAMKQYRSSEWRFPDTYVQADVSAKAKALMQSIASDHAWGDTNTSAVSQMAENAVFIPNKTKNDLAYWESVSDNELFSAINEVTSSKNLEKEKVTEMQHDFVKQLRIMMESEVNEAEIIIAARGFSKTLQEMIEKIGRLQNEDLPPLSDQMREQHDQLKASSFQQATHAALQGVMDSLYSAKDSVDGAVQVMAKGEQPMNDMDGVEGLDSLDPMDELAGLEDEFGGDVAASGPEDEPLGRAELEESIRIMQAKLASVKATKGA